MTHSSKNSMEERDATDAVLSRMLRATSPIHIQQPLPTPSVDEPTDDDLLLMVEGKREVPDLDQHPFSRDRVAILSEALAECGYLPVEAAQSVRLVPDPEPARQAVVPRLVFALMEGAQRSLEYLRGTMQPLILAPAAAPTRGESMPAIDTEPVYQFAQQLGDLNAQFHVEGTNKGVEVRLRLEDEGVPLSDGRASLRRASRGQTSTLVNSVRIRNGIADFCDLSPDRYIIDVKKQGELVGSVTLDILAGRDL